VRHMSHIDAGATARPEVPAPPAAMSAEDSIPAARLLAHDLEALVWDDDGDGALPPPD
jgi:hypothetical protein